MNIYLQMTGIIIVCHYSFYYDDDSKYYGVFPYRQSKNYVRLIADTFLVLLLLRFAEIEFFSDYNLLPE